MSRPIKFRVWNKEFESWRCTNMCLRATRKGIAELDLTDEYVVEQYTGLTDKNGKEIYEGDIVCIYKGGSTYEVAWMEKDGGWFCFSNDDDHYEPLYHADFEVIGNIHENPELLEDKR